jgi:hypothetical protein
VNGEVSVTVVCFEADESAAQPLHKSAEESVYIETTYPIGPSFFVAPRLLMTAILMIFGDCGVVDRRVSRVMKGPRAVVAV